MTNMHFTGNQPAYLLGAVALMLRQENLIPRDREVYENLRDILAAGMILEPDVQQALGLDSEPEPSG